jgi:preprotein translocase subunit YajC
MTLVIYLVVIVLVFYFFMIRPEKKKRKQADEMRSSISVGDNVTTIGGMVGKVVNVSDDFITFETGEDRVRIKIAKWGVSSVGKDAEEPDDKAGN